MIAYDDINTCELLACGSRYVKQEIDRQISNRRKFVVEVALGLVIGTVAAYFLLPLLPIVFAALVGVAVFAAFSYVSNSMFASKTGSSRESRSNCDKEDQNTSNDIY
jgi:hypothetical protein